MQEAKRNLHVPLSEDVYQVLRMEAERRKRPATEIVREVPGRVAEAGSRRSPPRGDRQLCIETCGNHRGPGSHTGGRRSRGDAPRGEIEEHKEREISMKRGEMYIAE